MEVRKRKITDYKSDPNNANMGTERGNYILEHSLETLGAGRSLLADANGVLIAGNKTFEKAGDLGFEDVIEVETDGKTLVVVKRTDLTIEDEKGRLMAYADNRAAQLDLSWNTAQIVEDWKTHDGLRAFFYDWEIDNLMNSEVAAAETKPEDQWVGMPEFVQEQAKLFQSIKVHFKTEDDMKAFAELIEQTITDKTIYIYYPKQEKIRSNPKRIKTDET